MEKIKDIEKIEAGSKSLIVKATNFIVTDHNQHEKAVAFGKLLKNMQAEVCSAFDPIIEKQHAAHKEACEQKRRYLDPLITAEKMLKNRISSFLLEEERKQEAERKKLEAERQKEAERLARQAEKAAAAGKAEKAEVLKAQAEEKKTEVVEVQETQKVRGAQSRDKWLYKVVNPALIPREYLIPNDSKLREVAQLTKGETKIAGIEFYKDKVVGF